MKYLEHVRQPTVQCSRPVNEQQHDHTTVDFVAENRVPPVTQVIDMLKEMKVKTETTKSQEQVDNSLALLTQEGLQKHMAFASKSQLYKDTTEMKARDVEEAQTQILAPSTKIEKPKMEQGDPTARVLELEGDLTWMDVGKATIQDDAAKVASTSSEIASLASQIATSDSDLKAASAVRAKETQDLSKSEAELVEVVNILEDLLVKSDKEKQELVTCELNAGHAHELILQDLAGRAKEMKTNAKEASTRITDVTCTSSRGLSSGSKEGQNLVRTVSAVPRYPRHGTDSVSDENRLDESEQKFSNSMGVPWTRSSRLHSLASVHAEDGVPALGWTKTVMAKHDLSKAQEVRSAEHAANTEQIADSTGAIEAERWRHWYVAGDFFRLLSSQGRNDVAGSEAKAVEEFKSFKTDTEAVLMQSKSEPKNVEQSCAETKETLASAEALNTETDSTFDTEKFDLTENIDDLRVAIAHLEKMSLAMNFNRIYDEDHSTLLSSLSDGDHQGYASQNDEIIGILKQLKETVEMTKLVETQEKAEALETCQSGAKSEKHLEHEAFNPRRK